MLSNRKDEKEGKKSSIEYQTHKRSRVHTHTHTCNLSDHKQPQQTKRRMMPETPPRLYVPKKPL